MREVFFGVRRKVRDRNVQRKEREVDGVVHEEAAVDLVENDDVYLADVAGPAGQNDFVGLFDVKVVQVGFLALGHGVHAVAPELRQFLRRKLVLLGSALHGELHQLELRNYTRHAKLERGLCCPFTRGNVIRRRLSTRTVPSA